jgi:hypothetical protein
MAKNVIIKPDSIRIKAFKKARPDQPNIKPVRAKKRK